MSDSSSHPGIPLMATETQPPPLPKWVYPLLALLIAGGVGGFLTLLSGSDPARAWHIFLVNFVFWSGAAIGGVAFAAIFQVANARWSGPAKRVAAACAIYLPASFLLFLLIWVGRDSLFPWVTRPLPLIASWLNTSSLFSREAICLLVLYGVALLFSYRLATGAHSRAGKIQALAVIFLLLYGYTNTIFAWDFIMSLHAPWTSTLFGGYYFIGNLYIGLAIVIILTVYSGWGHDFSPRFFHNLGKLLFSFSLLWTYLFWSQYLVIWYGNLPREIDFVQLRTAQNPWSPLALVILVLNFLIPFVVLMPRSSKENRKVLLAVAVVVVIGMWLERFLLVMPSLTSGTEIPMGWAEMLITLGFFASFALIYLPILSRIPILSTAGASPRH